MIAVIEAKTLNPSSFHTYESEALKRGIEEVSVDGKDRFVAVGVDERWMLEADTKVDDEAPFFPVIVHRWSE